MTLPRTSDSASEQAWDAGVTAMRARIREEERWREPVTITLTREQWLRTIADMRSHKLQHAIVDALCRVGAEAA